MVFFLGEPLRLDDAESPTSRTSIATVFPQARTIVTLPGIHASQRQQFVEHLNRQRAAQQLAPLNDDEQLALWQSAVDLIVRPDRVLIRPDPERMDLAFDADSLLVEAIPKRRIRFLFANDQRVRDAIRRRGEAWRINPLPKSADEIRRLIAGSLTSVGGRALYYYNAARGSRVLTCDQFARLADLDDDTLRDHLAEIATLAGRRNAAGYPELELFMASGGFTRDRLANCAAAASPADLRARLAELAREYVTAVPSQFRLDQLDDPAWRCHMYAALIGHDSDELSETDLLGLSDEFYLQIDWLPGANIDHGELLFDPALAESPAGVCEATVRGLICNLMQELSNLDFVNIGRVVSSLSRRARAPGRREVYVVHFRQRGAPADTVQIIRMQKWGVREHLDEGKDLVQAMVESEEYTDYIMDRRLGCLQLGMNLPPRLWTRKLAEAYTGPARGLAGSRIWSPYTHRDFVPGLASDKLPVGRVRDPRYASALGTLLGRAAAVNLIVGRCDATGRVIFDDGDEVVVEDAASQPAAIVVTDPTGAFAEYHGELAQSAGLYATPINSRRALLTNPDEFAERYIDGFITRLTQVQQEYLARRSAFDGLFRHRMTDPAGNFAWRWQRILGRLARAKPEELAAAIRANIQSP